MTIPEKNVLTLVWRNGIMWVNIYGDTQMEEDFGLENDALQMRIGNYIYFYDEISPMSALKFVANLNDAVLYLQEINQEDAEENIDKTYKEDSVKIFIDSPGGNGMSAITMLSAMNTSPFPIDTYIVGNAASAATLIACCGRNRYMYEYASYLIHQPSMGMGGKYADMKMTMEQFTRIYDFLVDIYKKNSKLTDKQIRELMSQESYFSANEALKYGLVDKIVNMPKRKFRKNGDI